VNFINNRTLHDFRDAGSGASTSIIMESLMPKMTVGQVESGTGGVLISGSRTTTISGVSIDTRTLQSGDIFFAIRGPHNDGHEFISAAFEKGAAGAVIDSRHSVPPEAAGGRIFLRVEDTHQALKNLAAEVRRNWRGSLIAITGSMGKTTTKEFAAQILQTEYSVYRSPGNYNNLFGLPLSICALGPDDHIGIFEMGMSARGEIAEMCRIARPDIGIITNVAPVHLEFFDSIDEIALAKAEMVEGIVRGGTLIYNSDNSFVRAMASRFNGKKISFGLSRDADIRAEALQIMNLEETRFRLLFDGVERPAAIPLAGRHYVMDLLPAVALAVHYHIPMDQVITSLGHLQQASMRGQIKHAARGFTLIDDSYNSNPQALNQMVETLSEVPDFNRKILVAGEMLELGKEAPSLHLGCGAWAARCGLDLVVAVRGNAAHIAQGALCAGLPAERVRFFNDLTSAVSFLLQFLQAGDLVLVKGSRAVRLDRLVSLIGADEVEQVH
jgi:UDP-N-acetylmuramoyl-tripeptide--D-alanyl-D-alanine ligase